MRTNLFLAAALLVSSADLAAQGEAPARGNPQMAFAGQSVDEMIASFMKENDIAGMSVAIVQAPYITRTTGFGVGDKERKTLVSVNTIFNIAQMKNAFTAVAVMQLVDDGKVSLDDPINKYIAASEDGDRSIIQLLRYPEQYALLETLIAKASGQSYREFLRKRQFERLRLEHTFFAADLEAMRHENIAPGEKHRRFLLEPSLIDPTEAATSYRSGAAVKAQPSAIYSSARDISIWDIGLAGEILIKSAALRKMLFVPEVEDNGRRQPAFGAWSFPGHEGLMVTTGSGEGSSSLLSRFTKSDELVCVTLLANKEGLDLTQLARKIAGAHNSRIGPPIQAEGMRIQQSPYGAGETMVRLERVLRGRGVQIVTRIDHSKAAATGDMPLGRSQELIFGNPVSGTEPADTMADLRLRAMAWEEGGEVWLAATDPTAIVKRSGVSVRNEAALQMRRAIDEMLLLAVSGN